MKKSLLFAFLMLSGCTKRMHVAQYAGNDFSHTSSMCLDALLVNMDKSNCNHTSMTSGRGILIVQCEIKDQEVENFWIDNTFFIVPINPNIEIIDGIPLCIDYNFGIYVPVELTVPEDKTSE